MPEVLHPATPGARPRELITQAARLFGRDHVLRWCEELLAGRIGDDDPAWPDIAWLGGTIGWVAYWSRVWGARGLLHIGPPARPEIVLVALGDESWRVREMCLKVIRRYVLPDPDARVDPLTDDPVKRVRSQAWAALGRPTGVAGSGPAR